MLFTFGGFCLYIEQQAWQQTLSLGKIRVSSPEALRTLKMNLYSRGSISIFGHVCAFGVTEFEQQIGISGYFPWKVHELSKLLSYETPSWLTVTKR